MSVSLADHERILQQALQICEAQLYQQFHTELMRARQQGVKDAALALQRARAAAHDSLASVALESVPSAPRVAALAAAEEKALAAAEAERRRLEDEMYAAMARHVTERAELEEEYEKLYLEQMRLTQRDSQAQLHKLLGPGGPWDGSASTQGADSKQQQVVAEKPEPYAPVFAAAMASSSRRIGSRSPQRRRERSTARSPAPPANHVSSLAAVPVPAADATSPMRRGASPSPKHGRKGGRNVRPESAPTPGPAPSAAHHARSGGGGGRQHGGSPSPPPQPGRIRPRMSTKQPTPAAAPSPSSSPSHAQQASSPASGTQRRRSGAPSPSRRVSDITGWSVPTSPAFTSVTVGGAGAGARPGSAGSLMLGGTALDSSSVPALIASINAALPAQMYQVLPERVVLESDLIGSDSRSRSRSRSHTPFGTRGQKKHGHTHYAQGVLHAEGAGVSAVSRRLLRRMERADQAVKAALADREVKEAAVEARRREEQAWRAKADAAALHSDPGAIATLSTTARRKMEHEALFESAATHERSDAATVPAASATATTPAATLPRPKSSTRLPTVLPDGRTIDPATQQTLEPLVDYALLERSPQQKLADRIEADLKEAADKQRRIDRQWAAKQRRGSAGAGGGGGPDDEHGAGGVDSIGLYLTKSSASLAEVAQLRAEALSPLVDTSSLGKSGGGVGGEGHRRRGSMHDALQRRRSTNATRPMSPLAAAARSRERSAEKVAPGRPSSAATAATTASLPSTASERRPGSAQRAMPQPLPLPTGEMLRVSSYKALAPATTTNDTHNHKNSTTRGSSGSGSGGDNNCKPVASGNPSASVVATAAEGAQHDSKHGRKPSAAELHLSFPSSLLAPAIPSSDGMGEGEGGGGGGGGGDMSSSRSSHFHFFGSEGSASHRSDAAAGGMESSRMHTARSVASSRSHPLLQSSNRSSINAGGGGGGDSGWGAAGGMGSGASSTFASPVAPLRSLDRSPHPLMRRHRSHQLSLQIEEPEDWLFDTDADADADEETHKDKDERGEQKNGDARAPSQRPNPSTSPSAAGGKRADKRRNIATSASAPLAEVDSDSSAVSSDHDSASSSSAASSPRSASPVHGQAEAGAASPLPDGDGDGEGEGAALDHMLDVIDSRRSSQVTQQSQSQRHSLRPSSSTSSQFDSRRSRDSLTAGADAPPIGAGAEEDAAEEGEPSALEITLASYRSALARSRRRMEAQRKELHEWERERDLLREQMSNVQLIAAQREEQMRAALIAHSYGSLDDEGGDGSPSAAASRPGSAVSVAVEGALGRLPAPSERYSPEDHQLNLLYFHRLLYAALREEKDLRFLRDTLESESDQLRARVAREVARMGEVVRRTRAASSSHKQDIIDEQKRVVAMLSSLAGADAAAREALDQLRSLARFWSQVHGWERAAPSMATAGNGGSSPHARHLSNAQTNNPLLPCCHRCARSLLPTPEDDALRVRMLRDKRALIREHAGAFAYATAAAATATPMVPSSATPKSATATVNTWVAPRSAAPSQSRPHSAMPLRPTSSMLPRGGSTASSTASLRSNLSGSSVTSSHVGRVQERKAAKTEWDVLEQLASMAAHMQTAAQRESKGKGGPGSRARGAVAVGTNIGAMGLPSKTKERMRMARDHDVSKFSGSGLLRPQTALPHPSATSASNGGGMGGGGGGGPARSILSHSHSHSSGTFHSTLLRNGAPAVSDHALAAARMMQLQLLSRERLQSHCDHFVQILSGQSVCRNCRYALESMAPSRPRSQLLSEEKGGTGPADSSSSFVWSQLDASRAQLATLFAPNQAAVRFFERRGLVDLDEVLPQPQSQATAIAATSTANSQRPRTPNPAESQPVRSHVVGTRPLPSCSDVQSTASTLALQPNRRAHAAAPDSLTLLRRLRRVLGFHPTRQQQSKPPAQYLASAAAGPQRLGLPVHDAPNPVLQSGGVAFANIWPTQQS